jgi:hypothetical protein
VFERLKNWFSGRQRGEPEIEYRTPPGSTSPVIPSAPPTSGMPPAAPVERPTDDGPEAR